MANPINSLKESKKARVARLFKIFEDFSELSNLSVLDILKSFFKETSLNHESVGLTTISGELFSKDAIELIKSQYNSVSFALTNLHHFHSELSQLTRKFFMNYEMPVTCTLFSDFSNSKASAGPVTESKHSWIYQIEGSSSWKITDQMYHLEKGSCLYIPYLTNYELLQKSNSAYIVFSEYEVSLCEVADFIGSEIFGVKGYLEKFHDLLHFDIEQSRELLDKQVINDQDLIGKVERFLEIKKMFKFKQGDVIVNSTNED